MKTELRSIYKLGCLCEYGTLNTESMLSFSFDESLRTCTNKSLENVIMRSCRILRKLLSDLPIPELKNRAQSYRFRYKCDGERKAAIVEFIVINVASAFTLKYHEWESKNESSNPRR